MIRPSETARIRLGEGATLVVVQEIPYTINNVRTIMYRLKWPTGMTTWHLRAEFEPVRNT